VVGQPTQGTTKSSRATPSIKKPSTKKPPTKKAPTTVRGKNRASAALEPVSEPESSAMDVDEGPGRRAVAGSEQGSTLLAVGSSVVDDDYIVMDESEEDIPRKRTRR